jgi:hypothetical protein
MFKKVVYLLTIKSLMVKGMVPFLPFNHIVSWDGIVFSKGGEYVAPSFNPGYSLPWIVLSSGLILMLLLSRPFVHFITQ